MYALIRVLVLLLAGVLPATTGCERTSFAGGEQGHGAPGAGDGAHAHGDEGPEPVAVTMFTPKVLLFMEYPQLVKGDKAEFLAHVTVLATGEPVRSGSMTFEVMTPAGEVRKQAWDAPRRDGLFVPEWSFDAAGEFGLRLVVDSPQVQEILEVGKIIVHATTHDAEHAADPASAGGDPPDAVSFLLEQQWKVGTLLRQVARRTLTRRIQLPGEIVPQHHAAAVVSAPVSGRLLRAPSGRLPQVGDRVEAGEVLALIEPPLPATEAAALSANRAQLQALDTELVLRSLDLGVKGLEVERAFQQAGTRLGFARRAFGRVQELKSKGVGSDQQYDEAQQNLHIAQAESDAALAMKKFYEESAAKLTEMQDRLKSRSAHSVYSPADMQLPLIAPISGQIVEHESVEGEHVEAMEKIYEIVNLERVWIVARISEFDLSQLPETPNATLELPSFPDRRLDVMGMGGRLVNIGTRVDPQTRTVPIRFEVPNEGRLFRAGMFTNVYLETQKSVDCLAVPESAIVLDNGRPLVYVMLEGETFQRREIELGVRDGDWVEVKAGVLEGERVAARAAYAIKLASLSPASFGHGHGH